jgi:hypothetical protein
MESRILAGAAMTSKFQILFLSKVNIFSSKKNREVKGQTSEFPHPKLYAHLLSHYLNATKRCSAAEESASISIEIPKASERIYNNTGSLGALAAQRIFPRSMTRGVCLDPSILFVRGSRRESLLGLEILILAL